MGTLINGVHHIALKCEDEIEFNQVVRFYTDVLQLDIKRSWETGIMIDLGNAVLEIFKTGKEMNGKGAVHHFAFLVDDVNLCIETVRNAGYEITVEPKDVVIPSNPPYSVRVAFAKGPLGEEIEFFHEYD